MTLPSPRGRRWDGDSWGWGGETLKAIREFRAFGSVSVVFSKYDIVTEEEFAQVKWPLGNPVSVSCANDSQK
jgi:hypothetical protein